MDGAARQGRSVALLHWGSVIEDFLDPIGVDFEAFRLEMTGGWMFGYLEAMRSAGLEPFLVCVTASTATPYTTTHEPTGIAMEVLPPTRLFRMASRAVRPMLRRRSRAAQGLTEYLATPVLRLRRVLRRRGCAVLLCQEYESPRFDVLVALAWATRRRAFATFQGANRVRPGRWGRHVERRLRSHAIRRCAGLVIASDAEADRVRSTYGVSADRIANIPNPVPVPTRIDRKDARRRVALPLDACVVAWHGRVQLRRKGLDVLLDAWEQVRRSRPDRVLRLVLVGSGSDDGLLRDRLRADAMQDDVVWIAEYVHDRDRINDVLAAADVYAFASPHEGFAVAPAEAMAMGIPVVATAASGVRELLPHGAASGGVIVPIGDAGALADAIGTLLDDPARASQLGVAARHHAEAALSIPSVGIALRAFLTDGGGAAFT